MARGLRLVGALVGYGCCVPSLLERYGPAALVTGAARGLGAAFARALAEEGFELVLVDIDPAVEQLARTLSARSVVLDLRREDLAAALDHVLSDGEIGLLINNAGAAATGPFLDHGLQEELDVLHLNTRAPLQLVHALAPAMVARGRGGVVLVASTVALNGGPWIANYAATKAYLIALGDALAIELRGTGVDLQVLAPGMTDTPGLRGSMDPAEATFPPMAAEAVVAACLRDLGRRHLVIPGAINRLSTALSRFLLPRRLRHRLMADRRIRPFRAD